MSWQFISFFGDSTVLLPGAVLLFIILLIRANTRAVAWQWGMLFSITCIIVSVSKLAFMGWGLGIRSIDFTGFSGHSALSAAFWPVFLWLLAHRLAPGFKSISMLAGYSIALLVACSRLEIHAHSVSEVIAGALLGAAASALFLWSVPDNYAIRLSGASAGCMLFGILILLNCGFRAPTQSLLGHIAVAVGPLEKPFTRSDLHKQAY